MKKMAEYLLSKLENERKMQMQKSGEYEEFLQQLWNKYGRIYPNSYNFPNAYEIDDITKRAFPNLGWDSVGMRKRSRHMEPDDQTNSVYLLNNTPREDFYNNDDDDYYNSKLGRRESKYDVNLQLPYMTRKRFPVTKRSSNFYSPQRNEKRSATNKKEMALKTDPKVAEELSNIFSAPKEKATTTTTTEKFKKAKKEHVNDILKKHTNATSASPSKAKTLKKTEATKEVPENAIKDQPLQIKKKSINWSDYFGLDKRKSKSDGDLDNEWLMERYHKAIAMATKRSDTSQHEAKKDTNYEDKKNAKPDDTKINDMDTKLKNIEDSIIDEALKFTGAHEGAEDTKEIQEVKDKVMTRLAAAYNLEKMRRALDEYRTSMKKERTRMKESDANPEDFLLERKRVSVPRKQAVDEEREKTKESDNNIRCTENDEECDEQNYNVPSELIDRPEWDKGKSVCDPSINKVVNFALDQCPKVQRACNEVASVLGHHGRVFETACNIHQICLLCVSRDIKQPLTIETAKFFDLLKEEIHI